MRRPGKMGVVRSIVMSALLLGAADTRADVVDSELSPGAALPVVRWGSLDREEPNQITARLAWRRVDGAAAYAGYRYHDGTRRRPRLFVEGGYAFEREAGLWSVELAQPILGGDRLLVGAGGWHATRHFEYDQAIVGSSENTLAALFTGHDYRDWFDGQGARLFGWWKWSRHWTVSAEATAEDERPLDVATDWSVVHNDDVRANPAAARGTRHAITLGVTHDTRPPDRREGIPFIGEVRRSNHDVVRLSWEGAGGPLGGDFDFGLVRLDARGYLKLTPHQFIAARVLVGVGPAEGLPPQKELFAGGISTLRAHPHKAFRGNRLALVNVDWSIDVWNAIQGLVFVDFGRAWRSMDHPNGPALALDGGIGVQTRDEHLRIHLARDLKRDDGGLLLSIRTNATF